MLHPALLSALLDDEVVVVINERLSARGITARRDGYHVHIRAPEVGEERILVLDAEKYDGEPVGVFVRTWGPVCSSSASEVAAPPPVVCWAR